MNNIKFVKITNTKAINLDQVITASYSPAVEPEHPNSQVKGDIYNEPTPEQLLFTMVDGSQHRIIGEEALKVFNSITS